MNNMYIVIPQLEACVPVRTKQSKTEQNKARKSKMDGAEKE